MNKQKTMGFVRSEMPYEKRIAILPKDMKELKHCDCLYFEKGYGKDFQISDDEYAQIGCHIVEREVALQQNIICDTKIGEASYLENLADHTTITGWIHAGANPHLTNILLQKKYTCYAWEDFYEDERHSFWHNNQIAGAGGVMNALQYTGYLPYGMNAGIIGRGDSAAGAFYMLTNLGAQVRQYSRKQESLFIKELPFLDIIVMAVRWDTLRHDHLISSTSRKHMKKDAIIIDISDDKNGAIEKSHSTFIPHPIYELDNIMVYSVGNVPSIYYKTATRGISKVMCRYIDKLIEQNDDDVLRNSIIIKEGSIVDKHIKQVQHR